MSDTSSSIALRPCRVEISTGALEHNYRFLQKLVGAEVGLVAMVKANAYGHGLSICAPAVVRAGAAWLGVTSIEEGVAARAVCPDVQVRILSMSGLFAGQAREAIRHRVTPVVWDAWQIDELEHAARELGCAAGSVAVHLELDTGMSRQGVLPAQLPGMLARFSASSPLRLEGVMTHLYAADEGNGVATDVQFARLREMLAAVPMAGRVVHVGNSAAIVRSGFAARLAELARSMGARALMRPGLALYGVTPEFSDGLTEAEAEAVASARKELQPVLAWKTRVVSLRDISAGQVVGYNGTFTAARPTRLALLAVGYADGLRRVLSNRVAVAVRGKRAPVAGRISMDQAVIDVTDVPDVAVGDEVVLLGQDVPVEEHAHAEGTIVWEVFTSIGERVQRVAVDESMK